MTLAFSAGSASASTPTARVRPARQLTDGQSVTVHWHFFDTDQVSQLVIAECTTAYRADAMETHCDLNPADIVVINPATRGGATPFTVHTGTVGDGTCGTSESDVRCLVAVIGIGGLPPLPVDGQSAYAHIGFAVA